MIGVVATPPIARFVEGEIRTLRSDDQFVLKSRKPQEHYPNPTEWVATGSAAIVHRIAAALNTDFMAIWGDTDWLFEGDELVWVPAVPASSVDREGLIDAYCTEIGADRQAASRELAERWLALRECLA
jgi:hypothetical protein